MKGYVPKAIVLYVGVNDAGANNSATVYANVSATMTAIHKAVPKAKVFYLSIIPTYAKTRAWNTINAVNARMRTYCRTYAWAEYIDVASALMQNGQPITKYFKSDRQHLTAEGYNIWDCVVSKQIMTYLSTTG